MTTSPKLGDKASGPVISTWLYRLASGSPPNAPAPLLRVAGRSDGAAGSRGRRVVLLGFLAFCLAFEGAQGRPSGLAADRPQEEEIPLKLPAARLVETLHPGLRCEVGAAVFRSGQSEVPYDLGESRRRELAERGCFELLEVPGRRP